MWGKEQTSLSSLVLATALALAICALETDPNGLSLSFIWHTSRGGLSVSTCVGSKRAGQGLPLTVPFSLRSSLRSSTSTAPLRPVPATGGLPTDSRGWSLPTKWAAPSWLGHQQVGSNVGKFPERAERHLVTCPCCVATHLVVGLMSESTT